MLAFAMNDKLKAREPKQKALELPLPFQLKKTKTQKNKRIK